MGKGSSGSGIRVNGQLQLQLEDAAATKLKLLMNHPSARMVVMAHCLQRSRVSLECETC